MRVGVGSHYGLTMKKKNARTRLREWLWKQRGIPYHEAVAVERYVLKNFTGKNKKV